MAPELDHPIPWYEDASIHTSMFFFTTFLLARERSSDSQVAVAGQEHRESLASSCYREETGEKDALKTTLIKHSCGTNVTTPTRRPGIHRCRAVPFEFSLCPSSILSLCVVCRVIFHVFQLKNAESKDRPDRPWRQTYSTFTFCLR